MRPVSKAPMRGAHPALGARQRGAYLGTLRSIFSSMAQNSLKTSTSYRFLKAVAADVIRMIQPREVMLCRNETPVCRLQQLGFR